MVPTAQRHLKPPLLLLVCPACWSRHGFWSGRWRGCAECGCSWMYSRALTAELQGWA